MDYTKFQQSIEERLAALADTDHNRKKKKIEADLDACLRQLEEKNAALKEAITADQYDEAVTIKEEIAKLNSKAALLKDTFRQLNEIAVYSDKDLEVLSRETTNFFNQEIAQNLKNRLKILEQLETNDQITEEIFESYKTIKKLIDTKATNSNYDYGYSCGRASYYKSINDMYKLNKIIESFRRK